MNVTPDVCYNAFVWLWCVPTLLVFSASQQVLACLLIVVVTGASRNLLKNDWAPVVTSVILIITGFAMMIAGVSLPGLGKVVGIVGAILSASNAYMLTVAVERQYNPVCV